MKTYFPLLLRVGLLSLCISAFLYGCTEDIGNVERHKQKSEVKSVSVDKSTFENETGLKLPINAKMLNYEQASGLDALYRVKLQLNASDFVHWIDQLMLKKENFSETKRYLLGQNTDWWQPQAKSPLPTAQLLFDNGMTLNLGYSKVNDKDVIVWLVYHGR